MSQLNELPNIWKKVISCAIEAISRSVKAIITGNGQGNWSPNIATVMPTREERADRAVRTSRVVLKHHFNRLLLGPERRPSGS
jgi:hypothetical protein